LKQIVTDWNILKPSKLIKTCCQLSKNQPALQSLERIWPGAHTAGAVWSAEQPFGMSFERRRLAWLIRRFTQRFNMFNGRGLRPGRGAQKGARSQRAAALSVRRRQGDHLEARLTRLTRLTPVPTPVPARVVDAWKADAVFLGLCRWGWDDDKLFEASRPSRYNDCHARCWSFPPWK
jgi:hypothetical protein